MCTSILPCVRLSVCVCEKGGNLAYLSWVLYANYSRQKKACVRERRNYRERITEMGEKFERNEILGSVPGTNQCQYLSKETQAT